MKVFDLNLKKFVKISRLECKSLDIKRGNFIYLLVDKDEIVYVGKTNKPNDRLYSHSIGNKKFTDIYYRNVSSNYLNVFESYWIFNLAPKYNYRMPQNRRYVCFDKIYRDNLIGKTLEIKLIGDMPYIDSKKYLIILLSPYSLAYRSGQRSGFCYVKEHIK